VTRVIESVADWQLERAALRRSGATLGLVPTMGALHEGHLSLVRRSRGENDRTLVSIFVNPVQFNDAGDFARYPRTLDADIAMLGAEGTDFVLLPTEEQLYPDGFRYRVTERERSSRLEGEHRPGHFDGVLTVVLKLLHIAAADRAYFGEKDWQQLALVRGMVEALFVPTRVVGCPTVREHDGLAMSSRNRLLAPAERARAPRLFEALRTSAPPESIARMLAADGFEVDYVEEWDGRRLAAVRLGGVRLIDNVPAGNAP
jgi:pantoate--beta-alanine ligase